ncbi:MAG TPA: hypothetical protein VMZ92_13835 [Planctomycetota bacterium]|nr:hypothetical protein [Planctomycetota bacterium]
MIRFKCERCNAPIKRPDTDAGTQVDCPTCRHTQKVPTPAPARPNRLLIVAGASAAVLLGAWLVWSMMGSDASTTSAEGKTSAEGTGAAARPQGPDQPEGEPTKADPRDATDRAWAEHQKLYEQRKLDEQGVRAWEDTQAHQRENERIEREIRLEKEREERARIEFERQQRLKEAEELRRKLLQQPPAETP